MDKLENEEYIAGRGAQIIPSNRFLKHAYVQEHIEGIDEPWELNRKTQVFEEFPKKIINKVDSPDISFMYSMNPYQGCEHGCIYCYARNTHEYWGFSAGLDFEQKVIVKPDAPKLLEKQLRSKNWVPSPIMFSGNTDCYQPLERKMQLTRGMLEVLLKFRHPAGMITKNALILRDKDILAEMAKLNLVSVMISITSLKEELRLKMEPRTATAKRRLQVIEELTKAGIPTGVMTAPIIPGLNSDEIPALIKAAADHGAVMAGYTVVRLNGAIGPIFTDWIHKAYPDRAEKVLNHIKGAHGGQLNDSRFGTRMRGEGNVIDSIKQLFTTSVQKHIKKQGRSTPSLNTSLFKVPPLDGDQLSLF